MRLICRVAGCEESEIHITVKTRTARVIPLIMMKPIEPIAVFSEADLT